MSEQTVTVPLDALRVLVHYADAMRWRGDQEFLCSSEEQDESNREFAAVVNALGVDGLATP